MANAASSRSTPRESLSEHPLVVGLLARSTFPAAGTAVVCALSGGPDSTAMTALAVAAGCDVSAVHVHHGLRESADADATIARDTADLLGIAHRAERVEVGEGANLEARARDARRAVLGADALTGHTLDDQAETLLLALGRGAGATGLAAIRPGPTRPILTLRRSETTLLCTRLGLPVAHDPTNRDPRFRRNRIRHELLPLLDGITERDTAMLLNRTADLLRDDDDLLDDLAAGLDPTDARSLAGAPPPLARRAVRRWLNHEGYPPDAATVARVLDVADGNAIACDVGRGRRVERSQQRLRLCDGATEGS